MDESGCHQIPIDKMLPGVSSMSPDLATLLRFQNHAGLNGGADGSPKIQKMTPTSREKFANAERSKNAAGGETFVKKSDKKRPTTFMERLKWLKKFPGTNMRRPKIAKSTESANFKSTLEKRKNFQHPKMFGASLANGNHDASKAVVNEMKDFESPKNINPTPVGLPHPIAIKNPLPVHRGKFDNPVPEELGIHHPAVQSSVTYKCRKCSRTSFESLEALKEHQLHCSSQASSSESALESVPPSGSSGSGGVGNRATFVLCSACGTYFENWNLFLHMRDVHHRHACLYCLGLFSRAEKLSSHLINKHGSQINYFKSKEEVTEKLTDVFYFVCCKCEVIFTQKDNFATHECNQVIKYCLTCDTKEGHKPDCSKNSKHKYSGQLDADGNKKSKKSAPSKQVFDPSVNVHPPMDVNMLDRNRYPGFDVKSERDLSNLSLLDGFGVNELNAMGYGTPEVKSENISASKMAMLIEEVKNCVAQPPPLNPVCAETVKPEEDNLNSSKDMVVDQETSQPTAMSTTESQNSTTNLDESKSNLNVSNSNLNNPETDALPPDEVQSASADKEINRVPKLTVKVPKMLTEKEASDYSSDSDDSDKLTVDLEPKPEGTSINNLENNNAENLDIKKGEISQEEETAGDDIPIIELTLDRPLDKYPLKDLLQVLLNGSIYSCIYCNHARRIAVNGKQLGLHFISQHKFTATVNSITAEELMPETIVSKIRTCLSDVEETFINLDDFPGKTDLNRYDSNYECFQCYYVTAMHKDLYFHNRKMHQKTILLCIMCKSSFYTYSELICHLCPGMYVDTFVNVYEMLFRCCICRQEPLSSAFRLMVHLRKRHHACDVCLEVCFNQSKLSSHVWKHKLHHLCYRCGLAYRNKPDITKHLFWKHGTESVLCKKCLQRKWPHVYHFCVPPNLFTCEECNINFTKAVYLKVHKRMHAGDYPYECKENNCTEKFISKKLLTKHTAKHSDTLDSERNLNNLDKSSKISDIIDLCDKNDVANPTDTKTKKSKKSKSFKDNLLIDVNLPALNLSESGSSDDSDTEASKKPNAVDENCITVDENAPKTETTEDSKPEPPVQGIWDNFKLYQESLEKQIEKPHIPVHVCESDHDYCVIPTDESPDVEIVGEIKAKPEVRISESRDSPKKKNKMSKKKNKSDTISSSSDSSSDSDSSCSCGTNCSCSSSSGSSSSSSSSDSSSNSSQKRRNTARKDSDASHNSAVDIMVTEESPSHLIPKSKDVSYAESDLDSEESATDEDFYDKNPHRMALKLLADKRNQLIQSASTSPVNNGSYLEISRPSTPNSSDKIQRKKIKVKKRKKEKKYDLESFSKSITDSTNIPTLEQPSVPNKITISLQSNTVQIQDSLHIGDSKSSSGALSDADSKRASKRRRVPNKFYGYSSDEELMLKPHLPPKLEWRKEDLPSPSVIPSISIPPMEVQRVPEIPIHVPEPIPVKSPHKESSSEDSESSKEGVLQIREPYSPIPREVENNLTEQPNPSVDVDVPFPRPTGAREAREGESVYCYCRCPYDEVSEMIACDAKGCSIEWFHFECVGIMVPPKGQWFCPDCRVKQDNLHK